MTGLASNLNKEVDAVLSCDMCYIGPLVYHGFVDLLTDKS